MDRSSGATTSNACRIGARGLKSEGHNDIWRGGPRSAQRAAAIVLPDAFIRSGGPLRWLRFRAEACYRSNPHAPA
jgi:hypothetical protein